MMILGIRLDYIWTQKIFWSDPYRTNHETVVSSVNGSDITLESTIFFAFSGGQESDYGTIQGIPVLSARKDGLEIVYTMPQEHSLSAGQKVSIEIDWARRYQLMRLHFAAELVLEHVYKELGGVDKVGAHIAQNKARIDFAWPQSISSFLPKFAEEANRIISADREIRTGVIEPSPPDGKKPPPVTGTVSCHNKKFENGPLDNWVLDSMVILKINKKMESPPCLNNWSR